MNINRKIEKMFIDQQTKFEEEIDSIFYQKETNTLGYYELENFKEVLDCCITNGLACEFYVSHSYKFLREYLRINNSLTILGAIKDDPQLIICIELLKNLNIKTSKLKTNLITLYIHLCQTLTYQPCKVPNQTLLVTTTYSNINKKANTPEDMFALSIKSLYRAELCFEALDYLINYFFEKFEDKLNESDYDISLANEIEENYSDLLDNYLEFKLAHFMMIKI
jgi:hypothetical protein